MKREMEALREENNKLKQDLTNVQKKTQEIEEIAKWSIRKLIRMSNIHVKTI